MRNFVHEELSKCASLLKMSGFSAYNSFAQRMAAIPHLRAEEKALSGAAHLYKNLSTLSEARKLTHEAGSHYDRAIKAVKQLRAIGIRRSFRWLSE